MDERANQLFMVLLLTPISLLRITVAMPQTTDTGASGFEQTAEKLACTLDDLLERYLNLLHQHQTLQGDLSKRLSTVGRIYCTPR